MTAPNLPPVGVPAVEPGVQTTDAKPKRAPKNAEIHDIIRALVRDNPACLEKDLYDEARKSIACLFQKQTGYLLPTKLYDETVKEARKNAAEKRKPLHIVRENDDIGPHPLDTLAATAEVAFYRDGGNYLVNARTGLGFHGYRGDDVRMLAAVPVITGYTSMEVVPNALHLPSTQTTKAYEIDFYPLSSSASSCGEPMIDGTLPVPEHLRLDLDDMMDAHPQWPKRLKDIPQPRKASLDRIKEAVDILALATIPRTVIYTSTGLLHVEGRRVFLHPGGPALTTTGTDARYRMEYPDKIEQQVKYGFLTPSANPTEQQADFRALWQIGDMTPGAPAVAAAMLGALGFAPAGQLTPAPNVIIAGMTGSLKSAVARTAALQSLTLDLHGRHDERSTLSFRGSNGTVYGAENILHPLAGGVALLDDLLQAGAGKRDIEKAYKILSELGGHQMSGQGAIRGVWNKGNGGTATALYPRCSMIFTVEALPRAAQYASNLARYAVLTLDSADKVDIPLLTVMQKKEAGQARNRAVAGYIQWLLGDERVEKMVADVQESIGYYEGLGVHSRTVDIYAKLEAGVVSTLRYGVALGVFTAEEAADEGTRIREALSSAITKQSVTMGMDGWRATALDPVENFYRVLETAMRDGKVYFSALQRRESADLPQPPEALPESFNVTRLGWAHSENSGEWIPPRGALEAGVLVKGGDFGWTARIAAKTWDTLFDVLERLAEREERPLGNATSLLDSLIERGGGAKQVAARLWGGRLGKVTRCHLLGMAALIEADDVPNDEGGDEPDTTPPSTGQDTPPISGSLSPEPLSAPIPEPIALHAEPEPEPVAAMTEPAHAVEEEPLSWLPATGIPPERAALFLALTAGPNEQSPPSAARPSGSTAARNMAGMISDGATPGRPAWVLHRRSQGTPARMLALADVNEERWFGEWARTLPRETLEDAWHTAVSHLTTLFPKGQVARTPGATGLNAIESVLPWLRDAPRPVAYPTLPPEIHALLHGNSTQHRQEAIALPGHRAKTLTLYDRRIAYLSHLRHLPTVNTAQHDTGAAAIYVPHHPGFYTVSVSVPKDWQHIGLVPTKDAGTAWLYPHEPGTTFDSLLTTVEMRLLADHAWPFVVRERYLFDALNVPGNDPLRTFQQRMVQALERLEAQPHTDLNRAVRAALRAVVIQAIGIFHRRVQTDETRLEEWDDVPEDADSAHGFQPDIAPDGTPILRRERTLNLFQERWHHPEWSTAIYAASRTAITKQALTLNRADIAAIDGDGLYLFDDPTWQDTGRIGDFRHEQTWQRDRVRTAPTHLDDYRTIKQNGGW